MLRGNSETAIPLKMSLNIMTPEQEAHLTKILEQFKNDCSKKYRNGQAEHGGNLWNKVGIIDMAIEEALDLYVYLVTLKDQLENDIIPTEHDTDKTPR